MCVGGWKGGRRMEGGGRKRVRGGCGIERQ